MASSRKPRNAEPVPGAAQAALAQWLARTGPWHGRRLVCALSGGMDSMVLLDLLVAGAPAHGYRLGAIHVHHGLQTQADDWARFCRAQCRARRVPLTVRRVQVAGRGEAAARSARFAVFDALRVDALVLAHHLDDQAETVLMRLLRGAGTRGAAAMRADTRRGRLRLLRPLLGVPREALRDHATAAGLDWIEDPSNAERTRTRNFLRHEVGPLLATRFPRWREALARAAGHFGASDDRAQVLLRNWLARQGLREPSEAKLLEMLRQLTGQGVRTEIIHDGVRLRVERGRVRLDAAAPLPPKAFRPQAWTGAARLPLPALGGELRFRHVRGGGIDAARLAAAAVTVRVRTGGERFRTAADRPRRTLKNLFQEAGVPARARARLPLVFCGDDLVWVPGLGVEAGWRAPPGAPGWLLDWRAG
ncbi:MAG TPA: tRNA lysidine(34) synthetase TilS [Burkholderiales bacterium]